MFRRAKLEVARNKQTFLIPFSIKYICLAIKNIVAAAIYTMLRFPLDPTTNRVFADCDVGNRILAHWKQTRGAAVMCHITATQETALGQAKDPEMQGLTCGGPSTEMGHCIWGVLPLIRGVTDSVDVDETNLITAFTEMSNPETPKLRVLMGEATRPTTPHPNCIAGGPTPAGWKTQFKRFYPNLKYGTPNEGGWGEIKSARPSTSRPFL